MHKVAGKKSMKISVSVTYNNVMVEVNPMIVLGHIEKDWVQDTFGVNFWIMHDESGGLTACRATEILAAREEQSLADDELVVYQAFVTLKALLRSKMV